MKSKPTTKFVVESSLTLMECHKVAKLNARLVIPQRADLSEFNIRRIKRTKLAFLRARAT